MFITMSVTIYVNVYVLYLFLLRKRGAAARFVGRCVLKACFLLRRRPTETVVRSSGNFYLLVITVR